MIHTLLITILVEGGVVLVYSTWRRFPTKTLLLASLVVNMLTQSMLRVILQIFFAQYLMTLLLAEVGIWLVEAILLYCLSHRQLSLSDALILSLGMNATSFGLGWFLPV